MQITKIDRVVTGTTEEKESSAWGEALSHRNKLLSNSDWTQLPDSGLTPECVTVFKSWRSSLKAIKRSNYPSRANAEKHISTLARRIPRLQYLPLEIDVPSAERYDDLNQFREQVVRYMEAVFNAALSGSFLDNHMLVEEQFREALDYLADAKRSEYPLLSVTAELYKQPLHQVASEFVERKVMSLKRIANLKQKYYEFQSLVSGASSDVELEGIQADITLWISTST